LDRYSNTLLLILNNRISIRDASVACGGVVVSPAGTYPSTGRSEATTESVLVDREKKKDENALKVRELGETESQDRFISESRMTLLHVLSFLTSPWGYRHRMILMVLMRAIFEDVVIYSLWMGSGSQLISCLVHFPSSS
jgi:hypothetical protein